LKTGEGVFSWPDGTKYEGQMFENELSGEGTCTRIDQRKYKGQWVGNKMEGRGVFTGKDGNMYEGEYKNDLKHGSGVFVYADGRRYDGQWEHGEMHGIGLWHDKQDEEGLGRKGEWARGEFQRWSTGSDEQEKSFSRMSTNCSTVTNQELASFLGNSVISDLTCDDFEEDHLPYSSGNHLVEIIPVLNSHKERSILSPRCRHGASFLRPVPKLSHFHDSEKDSDCATATSTTLGSYMSSPRRF
jgi:hypothetical protein